MQVGSFGDLAFEVSSELVRTFDDYRRETKARYSKHDLINMPPVHEWLGEDAEEISFKMIFTTALGVNPAEEVARLRQLCLDGEADYLVLGNELVGNNLWVIESVGESAKAWTNDGHIMVCEVDVKMIEYVAEVPEQ